MNKKYLNIIFALTTIILSSCTINKPVEQKRYITVQGEGSSFVDPEIVSMNFSVKTNSRYVVTASERNAILSNNVINSLKNLEIAESDISTSNYQVQLGLNKQGYEEYFVENTIQVIIRNPAITSKVIDTAILNGSNSLTNFEYLILDDSTAKRQARTMAIKNAQDAANLLAGASGCKVGIVTNIEELYINTYSALKNKIMKSENGTPIETGKVEIAARVTMTFELE